AILGFGQSSIIDLQSSIASLQRHCLFQELIPLPPIGLSSRNVRIVVSRPGDDVEPLGFGREVEQPPALRGGNYLVALGQEEELRRENAADPLAAVEAAADEKRRHERIMVSRHRPKRQEGRLEDEGGARPLQREPDGDGAAQRLAEEDEAFRREPDRAARLVDRPRVARETLLRRRPGGSAVAAVVHEEHVIAEASMNLA